MGDVPLIAWEKERLLRDRRMRIKQNQKNRKHSECLAKRLNCCIKAKKNFLISIELSF